MGESPKPRRSSKPRWKTPLYRTIVGVFLSAALAPLLSKDIDKRWIPVFIALALTFAWTEIIKNRKRKRIAFGATFLACVAVLAVLTMWPSLMSLFAASQDVKYVPPKGRLIAMQGNVPVPSSQMCTGLPEAQEIQCLCPRPLKYELAALSPPSDTNFSTELTIHAVREPMYRLRVFARTAIVFTGPLFASPHDEDRTATVVQRMDYDPYSIVIRSSAPQELFKIELHTPEGLRIKCVNQEN